MTEETTTESNDGFKEVTADAWKPEQEGDSITGVYQHMEERSGDISEKYFLKCGEEDIFVWGSTILNSIMKRIKVGQEVRITFKGKGTTKTGRDLNIYKVEVKEE